MGVCSVGTWEYIIAGYLFGGAISSCILVQYGIRVLAVIK